jgi:CheY-like chemotaxis protein
MKEMKTKLEQTQMTNTLPMHEEWKKTSREDSPIWARERRLQKLVELSNSPIRSKRRPLAITLCTSDGKKSVQPTNHPKIFPLLALLVEDDQINQLVMKAKLHSLSSAQGKVTCDVVDTAEAVLELLSCQKFAKYDLILMDQNFDNAGGLLTGTDVVKEIKRMGYLQPIIMCSGEASAYDVELYLDAGASLVWPKPYPTIETMLADIYALFSVPEDADSSCTLSTRGWS